AFLGMAFSPEGTLLATASTDGTLKLRQAASGKVLRTLGRHASAAQVIAFSRDGKLLASGGKEPTVRGWEGASGGETKVRFGHAGPVFAVAFGPGGELLSAAEDGTARLWDVKSGKARHTIKDTGLRAAVLTPDGKTVATVGSGPGAAVKLWDAGSGKPLGGL